MPLIFIMQAKFPTATDPPDYGVRTDYVRRIMVSQIMVTDYGHRLWSQIMVTDYGVTDYGHRLWLSDYG